MSNISGMDSILSKLEAKKSLAGGKKLQEFLQRLFDVGYETAKSGYDASLEDGIEVDPDPEWINGGTGFYLRARGRRVLFVEFGSGLYQNSNPKGEELGFTPASWSDTHKGFLLRDDWWIYTGQQEPNSEPAKGDTTGTRWWTQGNQPANAMLQASEEMRGNIERIAKEVFGS